MKIPEKILITFLIIFILALLVHAANPNPAEFGDSTTTTVWIGGYKGVINTTGNSNFGNHSVNMSTIGDVNASNFYGAAFYDNGVLLLSNYTRYTITNAYEDGLTDWDLNNFTGAFNVIYNLTKPIQNDSDISARSINATNYYNGSGDLDWITCANVQDIDKECIESDLNTWVDIAGDNMTGMLNVPNLNVSNDLNVSRVFTVGDNKVNISASGDVNATKFYGNYTGAIACDKITGSPDADFCTDSDSGSSGILNGTDINVVNLNITGSIIDGFTLADRSNISVTSTKDFGISNIGAGGTSKIVFDNGNNLHIVSDDIILTGHVKASPAPENAPVFFESDITGSQDWNITISSYQYIAFRDNIVEIFGDGLYVGNSDIISIGRIIAGANSDFSTPKGTVAPYELIVLGLGDFAGLSMNDTVGFSGTCADGTSLTVLGGIITACS